jgi:hypothetical protein
MIRIRSTIRASVTTLGALLLSTALGAENELPAFQTGLWSFTSTITTGTGKPEGRKMQLCTNPTEDIKKKWDKLSGTSCKFTPITHAGDRYTYTSVCQNNGVLLQTKSSIVVVQPGTAYQVETESRSNNQTRRELVVAQRVGDCAATARSSEHPK